MDVIFSQTEKEAIVSVLLALSQIDFVMHDKEHVVLEACLRELEFNEEGFHPIPPSQLEVKAFMTLKNMMKDKKRTFSLMMTKIARSDGNFGPRERAFVSRVLEMCEIPFVHK